MRNIVLSIVVASTALAAAPASAQAWRGQPTAHRQIQTDIAQLDRRIDRSEQRRAISPREANALRRQGRELVRTYNQYRRNGLSRREVAALEVRIDRLHQRLRLERRDRDGRRG